MSMLNSLISRINPLLRAEKLAESAAAWTDRDCGIYSEKYFNEMLRIERKRTERSGKPFILILLDVREYGETAGRGKFRGLAKTICSLTRDIDVKGWYSSGTVIGLMLLEISGSQAAKLVAEKLRQEIIRTAGEKDAGAIKISFHLYPEEKAGRFDPALYPDLRDRARGASGFKRLLDLTFSAAGLLLLAPVFAVIALLIKLTSKGPVLFRQERVGRLGKSFIFLKFRSMYVNRDHKIHEEFIRNFIKPPLTAASRAPSVYKIEKDPRVTPLGHFLRKTSLDELPQLLNVLRGEMSLIGPRPPLPYECIIYEKWHLSRVQAKPGITGLWQVKGRSRTSFDEMVRLDIKYIREWSPWLDIKILFKTPWAVFTCRGAY